MFDYLDDAAAIAMLRALEARLAPGGKLTVFQFAPHNPTRAYMEWLGNWYLTYRDANQLQSLVHSAGVPPAQVRFGAEPLGVDLFATIDCPRPGLSPAS
jgi:extracellular factor (EF) 3-hydroxypalmitic acid methyl ester biosynthesis protein